MMPRSFEGESHHTAEPAAYITCPADGGSRFFQNVIAVSMIHTM